MKGNRKNIKKISMIGGGEHAMFIDVSKTQVEKEKMTLFILSQWHLQKNENITK